MSYAVGSLVRVRGREWVVLPNSTDDTLLVRPLGGTEDEVTGIYLPLEPVEPAVFPLPDPTQAGDYRSARLLRDAVRLGFRSSAGPFRSFARIAVDPRPYQLVPLLMALKLDPVRLLIADDVGIGKTIEACLIVRELLDRGEIQRLAVLCPPHLAEQWQQELSEKFYMDAELVLPSTATRLERHRRLGQSIFDNYPFVIVSTDFIKSDRRRDEFLRTCPECVIVDEAHGCAYAGEGRGSGHQRHALVAQLAADRHRHLLLVTATPHSGNEAAFRSLLTLLDPDFAELPDDLSGAHQAHHRRRLAAHLVQRRRGDIRHYLADETPFPTRESLELTYRLSAPYQQLFERVLRYARELVQSPAGSGGSQQHRQRVRWWSALALLRALASSPAAAAATLRSRAASADTETPEEADAMGRRTVLDQVDDEAPDGVDMVPGSEIGAFSDDEPRHHRRLLELARAAEDLKGTHDTKLQGAADLINRLIQEGYQPIVFCRFVATAEYVAEELRKRLPKGVEVSAVTGSLPHDEREARVAELGQAGQRVLVATDCLSEGINLQAHFNAVLHYDLSWNPTRHEQREGRIDRYGQPASTVRAVTYYGIDNQIDGLVLDVLLRKHQTIRNSLGVSVPVPANADDVLEAMIEGLLLRGRSTAPGDQLVLPGMEEMVEPRKEQFFALWEANAEREKRSRTMFAQETIKVDEVQRELEATRAAIGSGVAVADFVRRAIQLYNGAITPQGETLQIDVQPTPDALRDTLRGTIGNNGVQRFTARFTLPVQEHEVYLSRTHPFVEGLATYVLNTALDPLLESIARRCGVIDTRHVQRRTTLLLVRFRFHIVTQQGDEERMLLAEDCQALAFEGALADAAWHTGEAVEALLQAEPDQNVVADRAVHFLRQVIENYEQIRPHLEEVAHQRGAELLQSHRRVRSAARMRGVRYHVEPQLPPDVLGMYVHLPIRNVGA